MNSQKTGIHPSLLSRPERLDRDWQSWASPGHATKAPRMLKTTYTVTDFLSWQREGSLTLKPPFQRNSVWSAGAKSYFIDTIIKDLPTPLILLRERRADLKNFLPHRDVVDGQQRLRTAISFVAPNLIDDIEGKDLFTIKEEHNKPLAGMDFNHLPDDIKERILNYQFSVNVFPSDTDDRIIIQLFSRLNATGYRLNKQELRNAEFYGPFKSLAGDLAAEQLNRWRDWDVLTSDNLARMADIEMTSEFMILMLKRSITEKSDEVISGYYEEYDESFPAARAIKKRFRHVFQAIDDSLSADVPRLFNTRTKFYALFVAIYDLLYGISSDLKPGAASALTTSAVNAIRAAGNRIADERAPDVILASIKRTPSHARERKRVVNYLLAKSR